MSQPEHSTETTAALDKLDEPLPGADVATRLSRRRVPGSTVLLLLAVAAVAVFLLGALTGRATAPSMGGPGEGPVIGTIVAVADGPGGPVVTVRDADGSLRAVRTTAGTSVGTEAAGGVAGLRAGDTVQIDGVLGADGSLSATRVTLRPPG